MRAPCGSIVAGIGIGVPFGRVVLVFVATSRLAPLSTPEIQSYKDQKERLELLIRTTKRGVRTVQPAITYQVNLYV